MTLKQIKQEVENHFGTVRNFRRHIHENPELSFQEFQTAQFIEDALSNLPFERLCETGLVATINAPEANASCIALRADIDALPIQEETGLDFASKNQGVMHACGHDMHSSILMGVAKIVHEHRHLLKKTVKFIFQLGEEKLPGGASMMIEAGVLENPKVDEIYGLHVFPDLEIGKVGFRVGKYMASCDEIYITINGKGGHAALPHTTIDPIYIGAQLIVQAQSIISRYANPTIPSVLSFGFFEGRGATNIIPDQVQIKGTFRTMNEQWRSKAHDLLTRMAQDLSNSFGAQIELRIEKGYPFLVNNEKTTQKARMAISSAIGAENVIELDLRMTAEDFSYYSQKVPATFFRIGVRPPDTKEIFGLHNSRFNPDEHALKVGMESMLAVVFS